MEIEEEIEVKCPKCGHKWVEYITVEVEPPIWMWGRGEVTLG